MAVHSYFLLHCPCAHALAVPPLLPPAFFFPASFCYALSATTFPSLRILSEGGRTEERRREGGRRKKALLGGGCLSLSLSLSEGMEEACVMYCHQLKRQSCMHMA